MTDDRKKGSISAFENLEVFKRAYAISLDVHRHSLTLPQVEQYALGDQLRRTSKSICANLAEGFAKRRSSAEVKRFVTIALGSADEMRVWIRYSLDLGYIDEPTWQKWRDEYQEIARMLQGLLRSWH